MKESENKKRHPLEMSEREMDEFSTKVAEELARMVERMVAIADEFDVDRDATVQHIAVTLTELAVSGTFEQFEVEEGA